MRLGKFLALQKDGGRQMPKKRTAGYGNESISSLKGADRVRKRRG